MGTDRRPPGPHRTLPIPAAMQHSQSSAEVYGAWQESPEFGELWEWVLFAALATRAGRAETWTRACLFRRGSENILRPTVERMRLEPECGKFRVRAPGLESRELAAPAATCRPQLQHNRHHRFADATASVPSGQR